MVALEETIMKNLGNLGNVDGHDAGSGEVNIFILTDHPKPAFDRIKELLGTRDFMPDLKVAFRLLGNDKFIILHPTDLAHFTIK